MLLTRRWWRAIGRAWKSSPPHRCNLTRTTKRPPAENICLRPARSAPRRSARRLPRTAREIGRCWRPLRTRSRSAAIPEDSRGADRARLLPHAAAALAGRRRARPADLCPGVEEIAKADPAPPIVGQNSGCLMTAPIRPAVAARILGPRGIPPGGRNCRVPAAASPSTAASVTGAGASPSVRHATGSARMSRSSSRTAPHAQPQRPPVQHRPLPKTSAEIIDNWQGSGSAPAATAIG